MAVFGNDNFSHILLLAVFIIIVVAVDKHDNVGVLLDGAGFTQVGKHGLFIRALLGRTRKLRQAYHRDVQFLRHNLERAGNLRDLLRTVVAPPAARLHELQIVDYDQAQPVAQAAAFGLDLRHRNRWIVIHINARFGEHVGRARNFDPILLGKVAGFEFLRFNERLACKETGRELILTHFELEYHHVLFAGLRGVERNIERKRRLAHAGTRRDENQVGFVEAGKRVVEVAEPG